MTRPSERLKPVASSKKQTSKRPKRKAERKSRLGLWTAVALFLLVGAYLGVLELNRPHVDGDRLRYDIFLSHIETGRIKAANLLDQDAYATGTYVAEGGALRRYNTPLLAGQQGSLSSTLVDNKVPTTVDQQVSKRVGGLAAILLPGLMIIVLFAYLLLSSRRGTGLFGIKSGARKIVSEESDATFADIAGQDAAVAELREIKEFLTDPDRFATLGAAIPKGVLLFGPPGCGKTMLARALAAESGASFFSISGSDFVEVYVGVGASRVRDLFKQAREEAPSIIFIDELDSIGRARGMVGTVQSHTEQEQSLNQILAEMDGFSSSEGIIVLGATNRPDVLDPALLRPGRFDRTIGLERPDEDARRAILHVHAKNKPLAHTVDLGAIARKAVGLTGADLASVVNEAALLAARATRIQITQGDLEAGLARIIEAPERQRRLSMRSRSIARRFTGEERITFDDVAGQDEAVAELREIREFLVEPERFTSLGASVPKGVLLFGAPGCGKTLLAKALASEANAAFMSVGASELVESLVGEGASKIRDMFAEARSMAPAIIFIDELDAIGRSRTSQRGGGGGGEQEQGLTQLLAEIDGFTTTAGVIVIGATNRPDVLDPALLRPGRFDRTIGLELPDEAGRLAILRVHARDKVLGPDVDLPSVAAKAFGLTGADLAAVLNEAAMLAGRANRSAVSQAEVATSLQRIIGAPERQRRLSLRGRSIGKRFSPDGRITFANLAGVNDAVDELAEVRDYLTNPSRFADLGIRVPRGVLMVGPPGCGKTMLARAVAGEANAAFFSVAASEFVEVFVGEGAARVRDLFADARAMAPSIVFIDELDGIGGHRSSFEGGGGGRERENTLNQILVELDGFETRSAVIVLGATNRPDMLDRALVRPGRFDRQVVISLPDRAGRLDILRLYTATKSLAADVSLEVVAGLTPGLSGADLENVVNEAALLAARQQSSRISMAMLEEGIDRAAMGVSSRGTVMTEEERRIVAYHEAGHALVAAHLKGATPPHKLTIIPRGGSLGRCTMLDSHERVIVSKEMLTDQMGGLLGGWLAEQLVFGDVSSAASSDIDRVGEIARRMVRQYGMSSSLGPVAYPDAVGGDGRRRPGYSDKSAEIIDGEVLRAVEESRQRAHSVLTTRRPALDRIAATLLEKETLDAEELAVLTGAVTPVPAPVPVGAATRAPLPVAAPERPKGWLPSRR